MKDLIFSNKKIKESIGIIKNIIEYKKASEILNSLPDKNILQKKIVFNTVKPYFTFLHRELFLGFILAKLGAEIYYLIDETGVFYHWDTVQKHNEKYTNLKNAPKNSILKYHFYYKPTIDTYKHKNIKIIPYSEIIKERDNIKNSLELKNNEKFLKKFAIESTRRYTQSGEIDFNDEKQKEYYTLSLENSFLSFQAGKYIENTLTPDIFITSHGLYSLWGPCYRYLVELGYRCIVYGAFYQIPQRLYIADKIKRIANRSKDWQTFRKIELSKEMAALAETYMKSRITHTSLDNKEHFSHISENANIDIGEVKNFETVICAFPNVIWDADIADINVSFDGVLDWLLYTINVLKDNKKIFLIIRCHPSEVTVLKGTQSVEEILQNKIKNIQDISNLKVISSSSNIDTYHFLKKYVDIGVLYDGTLGLEMPYLGIPTLIVGKGRFNNKNVNIGVDTKEKYHYYLTNPNELINEFHKSFDKDMLFRYIYWYLYEQHQYFPIFDKGKARNFDLTNIKLSNIDIFKNPEFKKTIEKIIGEPIELEN